MKWRETRVMWPEFMTIDASWRPPVFPTPICSQCPVALFLYGLSVVSLHNCAVNHACDVAARQQFPSPIRHSHLHLRSSRCSGCCDFDWEMVSGNKLVSSLYWLCCCRRNRSFEESQQQPQQQQLEQQNMCTPLQDVCYAMLCFSCAFAFALAMLCLNACLQAGWANCINVSLFPLIAHIPFFFKATAAGTQAYCHKGRRWQL